MAAQEKYFTKDAHIMVHMNGQQVITVNGDRAENVHYCRAALLTTQNGKDVIVDNYIRYVDQLVKQDGVWRIAGRDQYFLMTESRPLLG